MKESKTVVTKRISGVDELRGLLALGIILFHYFAMGKYYGTWMTHNATSDWGSIIVYVFFIVSGICLYKSNRDITIRQFYFKRWKALYPAFYIAWVAVYIIRTATTGSFNPDGASLWTIPLTIAGVDGYFLYLGPNFYLIGEWFLGAIIFLYLLYPLTIRFFKKAPVASLIFLFLLTAWAGTTDIFTILAPRNIICCLTGFVIGMFLGWKDILLDNKWVALLSGSIAIILLLIPLKYVIPQILLILLCSSALFLSLRFLFDHLGGGIFRVFKWLGGVSYEIFLVQHIVIIIFYKYANPQNWGTSVVGAILVSLAAIISAKLLSYVTEKIKKTKPLKKLDNNLGI